MPVTTDGDTQAASTPAHRDHVVVGGRSPIVTPMLHPSQRRDITTGGVMGRSQLAAGATPSTAPLTISSA